MAAENVSEFAKSVQALLKEPIGAECYMVALPWWSDLDGFLFNKDEKKKVSEPGAIYNLDLVYDTGD